MGLDLMKYYDKILSDQPHEFVADLSHHVRSKSTPQYLRVKKI
jgi:hypothetical protein